MDRELVFTLVIGLALFLVFWHFFSRALGMRAQGRDMVASGLKDLQSGRQKIKDGRKSLMSGTLLLLAVAPMVILIGVILLRACSVVSD